MISAFGVEHTQISKADDTTLAYNNAKKRGDKARNVGLGAMAAGGINGGVAGVRTYKANKPLFNAAAQMGLAPPVSAIKQISGRGIHRGIAGAAGITALSSLGVNRINRRAQRKAADTKFQS